MKKLILILGLGIAMTSCSDKVIVQSVNDGQTMRLNDGYNISKVGDTLVVIQSATARNLYGKFVGQMPKNTISLAKKTITFKKVIRIK